MNIYFINIIVNNTLESLCLDVMFEKRLGVSRNLAFFDGIWHDETGRAVDVPPETQRSIISKISRIESANYATMPSMIMLDDAESMEDFSDYLQCPVRDMFIFYSDQTQLAEFESPSSRMEDLRGVVYMLASCNNAGGIRVCEIADLCGSVTNPMTALRLFNSFMNWAKAKNIKVIGASCRESTSNRLFAEGTPIMAQFEKNGYVKLPVRQSYNMMAADRDETFHINVVVDKGLLDEVGSDFIRQRIRNYF